MKRDNPIVKYRVAPESGHPAFPVDMLRYDAAYPMREADSSKITDTITYNTRADQPEIELIATASGCPNDARWRSFGWHVTHVWNGSDWERYMEGHPKHRVTK